MTKPLNLNSRQHWAVKAKQVSAVRQMAAALTRAAKVPPLLHITVELYYIPRDKRRRDPLNLVAMLKPIEDGIVDAGVIPDDTPEFLTSAMPTIKDPTPPIPKLYFVIRETNG